ncbi:MAG: glycerol-3-phosphate dehydrogenase/oxidase [Nitrospirota bacterium]
MKRDLNKLSSTEYDVVIVGAGIYGASAAWDASLRGLKVALIDRGDFANATSSNSLKIIHGGLRYLQQLDIKRVRESIHEQKVLMKIAPHLIHPLPFIMPTYGYGLKSRPSLFFALFVIDLIGFDQKTFDDSKRFLPRGRLISREKVKSYIPNYEKNDMSGGALWYDCQCFNTERLVLSYILSASKSGADIANYVECTGFLLDRNKVTGIKAKDYFTGDIFDIKAKIIVNTCGPWVDILLKNLNGRHPIRRFIHSSAMNIVIKRRLLDKHAVGLSGSYYSKREDGSVYKGYRILFFVPWREYTLIGTNHLPYYGDPGNYRVTEAEIQNFLDAVNQAYPGVDIKREEVSFFHGGLLPMTGVKPDTGEVKLLKKYCIHDHSADGEVEGLITVVGVKYTTHRDIVSRTIDLVFKKLQKKPPKCLTEDIPIYGGKIEKFEDCLAEAIRTSGLDEKVARHLVYNYGSKYRDILKYGQKEPSLIQIVDGSDEVLRAEILNAVQNEMALKLSDVVLRRTDLGSAGNPGKKALREAAKIMAEALGWNEERIDKEIEEVTAVYIPAD